jgi:predicted double-glycine peptidase
MAATVSPAEAPPPGYAGLGSIFQYTNGDGRWVPFNCGQAAACTFLTHLGVLEPAAERAGHIMRLIEAEHPPDNVGGYFGTSRRRVERICRAHGVELREIQTEEELKQNLTEQRPVIVMLGVAGPRFWKWTMPAGHWMVAYGFDHDNVYLTNWGYMSWEGFRQGWDALVPRMIGMSHRGLVAE